MARPHVVAALVDDGISPFELGIVAEFFGVARADLEGIDYRLKVCAPTPGRIATTGGYAIEARFGLRALASADTVVVIPGLRFVEEEPPRALLDAIRRAHARGTRVVSLCVGAFVLAAAGLLDGRAATTHWRHAARLAGRYPGVRVQPEVLFVDEGQVLTSAGAAAGIDLCLHLVRLDCGAAAANRLARRVVVAPMRQGGQAQYVERPVPTGDSVIGALQDWALARLGEPLAIGALARRVGMSPRTFARRFVEASGVTPLQWLLDQRILEARRCLESAPRLSVEEVARRCGFGDVAAFRRQFRRRTRTSPAAYRAAFAVATDPSRQNGRGREPRIK